MEENTTFKKTTSKQNFSFYLFYKIELLIL